MTLPRLCPLCGKPAYYFGLNFVECDTPNCPNYVMRDVKDPREDPGEETQPNPRSPTPTLKGWARSAFPWIMWGLIGGCAGASDPEPSDAGRTVVVNPYSSRPGQELGSSGSSRGGSDVGGHPLRDSGQVIDRCRCWVMPERRPPWLCFVQYCIACPTQEGGEGHCFYTGEDPL